MYQIVRKRLLNSPVSGLTLNGIYLMDIKAPWIARAGKPGQFVIVIPKEKGERVPLTICDLDTGRETVTIVYQVVGDSTRTLADMNEGDSIYTIVGPLGQPGELLAASDGERAEMRLLFVAGGVGTAPVYPQVKWAHEQGIPVDVIIGARGRDLLFFEEEMRAVCDNLYLMTDDGSYGGKGLVTDKIQALYDAGRRYSHCVAIGPLPMMKFVSLLTRELGLKTIVSMNCMMVDGTGMCGACRLTVGGKVKFTCVDGPEFDGHLVDFDEAGSRLRRPDGRKYRIATVSHGHRCNLAEAVEEAEKITTGGSPAPGRQKPREQDPAVRAANFEEVSFGFTREQAVAEARRCLHCRKPMCVGSCPVSINIPEFIAAVAQEDFARAADIIARDSSLPAICGRVCPQETQCEGSCILGRKGQPIAIGALERFVADQAQAMPGNQLGIRNEELGMKKVAVIGSGPSGLTCAGDLAKK